MLRRAALPLAVLCAVALAGCGSDGSDTATDPGSGASSVKTVPCTYGADGQSAGKDVDPPSSDAPAEGTVSVTLKTSAGDIPIELDAATTPCAVNSFVSLADQGYFDNTPCHRLTTQGIYVLQCGDPAGSGMGGPGYKFDDELSGKETYDAGTVAMANAGPNTNGSQFFLVYADGDTQLPAAYDVIGQMDQAGTDLVKQIADKGTADGGPDGAPKEPVTIESVSTD
jgi:peptidyl-prolyl cis-trans isomerase B (cyclophilin B)